MDELIKFFQDGGFFMYVNVGSLVFAMTVVAERCYALFVAHRINEKTFTKEVDRYLQAGNLDAAAKVCQNVPVPALSRATRNLLKLLKNGYESPMIAVEESMLEVRPLVQARVGWLWSIANIATLIGLIGTILGLIGAFSSIGKLAAADRANTLSLKISEAMNNTAFGLIIAVICIIAHLFINNRAVKTVENAEHALFHFVNLHAQWRKGKVPAPEGNPGAR
jgi:biopolymer transport protein ExbB/TolQ